MLSIFLMVFLAIIATVMFFVPVSGELKTPKKIVISAIAALSVIVGVSGSVAYNPSGYAQHIQTIFGTEGAKLTTGWYFEGWGRSTSWPKYITVSNTSSVEAEGSSVNPPYQAKFSDNWVGGVTQSTRFEVVQDRDQFIALHNKYRSPARLISTALKPAVTASIDSVSNMFSMEEYYAGGKRDQYKSEYKNTISSGRAKVRQVEVVYNSESTGDSAAANSTETTGTFGDNRVRMMRTEKVLDENGNVIRVPHDFMKEGISVSLAILEQVDPDDEFEIQIKKRKDAAARRVIAKEQRLEQEEQRLLAIQAGKTDIAKRQAQAKVEQIQKTTEAETAKELVLINSRRLREEAEIAKETAAINLEKSRIEAEAVTVTADAEAYAKKAILEADGALQQKLNAWVEAQVVWAEAASKINVPATVIGGREGENSGSALGVVDQFMSMMMVKTAKDLQVNPTISK